MFCCVSEHEEELGADPVLDWCNVIKHFSYNVGIFLRFTFIFFYLFHNIKLFMEHCRDHIVLFAYYFNFLIVN